MGLIAGIIGLIVPGLGQVANRQVVKGLAVFILMVLCTLGTYFLLKGFALRELGTFAVYLFFAIYGGLDAYLFDSRTQEIQDKQLTEFIKFKKESERKPKKS
jgi:TM2 domain-containing membrane protein YozV